MTREEGPRVRVRDAFGRISDAFARISDAAEGIGIEWRARGRTGRTLIVAALVGAVALAGGFAFGLWHVLFGGLVNGNPRAAAFGLVLAVVSGMLLVAEAFAWRRVARR
jgi:hypothetical protein